MSFKFNLQANGLKAYIFREAESIPETSPNGSGKNRNEKPRNRHNSTSYFWDKINVIVR